MKRADLIVVGAGPAGLSAAIEAARRGLSVIVFDENEKPGGQLFKQIHKFFGSKEHRAKIRGIQIGSELLAEAHELGVEVMLGATVIGLYQDKEIAVRFGEEVDYFKGDAIVMATGASENMATFKGWTLPGVIGAGAAQTMMNLHGIKPGQKVVMLGSGNVGLVVSFQLMQAGCQVVAIVDAAPKIGGYGVHAAKLARCGVPFYLSHVIKQAKGEEQVEEVIITQVDASFKPIAGSEKKFDCDTICIAVGLSPMSQLLKMAGCEMIDDPSKGGEVPVIDQDGETSIKGVFAAGDVSGIEEASSAMIEGSMAGICVASRLGFIGLEEKDTELKRRKKDLESLRQGMFAPENRGKIIEKTDEGHFVSSSLLQNGYISDEEIGRYPGVSNGAAIHPVMECTQNIPCNPCQDACSRNCIKIGENITALPVVNDESKCSGCGLCVAACSGQAIFLVSENAEEGFAEVTLPYEFLPLPQKGHKGIALTRSGESCCEAEVVAIKSLAAYDHTNLLTIKVPLEYSMNARFFKAI
ncbi:FAD-dependent oxidoreductase [Eubacteriaceae bacterium ES3]|nr:FAD-dependent oxidoreductase [Eubacteriaceae bacterium ES3]